MWRRRRRRRWQVLPVGHVEACFGRLGGPKLLRVDPAGGHRVMHRRAGGPAAALVARWAMAALEGALAAYLPVRAGLEL
jgi:hypothetical protein